jgi:hypothetical protein
MYFFDVMDIIVSSGTFISAMDIYVRMSEKHECRLDRVQKLLPKMMKQLDRKLITPNVKGSRPYYVYRRNPSHGYKTL